MTYVYRVVNGPKVSKLYPTRGGALKAASYWKNHGHPMAQAEVSPVVWSAVGGVADAGTDSPSSTGPSGSNAAGPVSFTG